jgi:quercetin dioxygenase-like cupin family protein
MTTSCKARVFSADTVEAMVVDSGSGTTKAMLLGPEVTPNFQMRRFVIQPGGSIPAHTNSVEHEQYVLGGAGRVGIGKQVYEVKAGDVLFIPPGAPHWYETVGDAPYEFLCLGPNGEDVITMIEKS